MAEGTKKIIGTILILLFLGGGLWFLSGQLKRKDEEQPEEGGEQRSGDNKIEAKPVMGFRDYGVKAASDEQLLADLAIFKEKLYNLKSGLSDQIRLGIIKPGSAGEKDAKRNLYTYGATIANITTEALKRGLMVLPSQYDNYIKDYVVQGSTATIDTSKPIF